MPHTINKPEVPKTKVQPWKAIWPAKEADPEKAPQLAKDGQGSLNGAHGYDDKGEAVAPGQ